MQALVKFVQKKPPVTSEQQAGSEKMQVQILAQPVNSDNLTSRSPFSTFWSIKSRPSKSNHATLLPNQVNKVHALYSRDANHHLKTSFYFSSTPSSHCWGLTCVLPGPEHWVSVHLLNPPSWSSPEAMSALWSWSVTSSDRPNRTRREAML